MVIIRVFKLGDYENTLFIQAIDDNGDMVYMKFNGLGTPDWTGAKDYAFTAPLEEIKKHKTTSWEIEEVK